LVSWIELNDNVHHSGRGFPTALQFLVEQRISFRREIEVGFEIEAKVECVAKKFATDACEASALIASSDFAYIHPNTS
jgi:hypothetical protein